MAGTEFNGPAQDLECLGLSSSGAGIMDMVSLLNVLNIEPYIQVKCTFMWHILLQKNVNKSA